MTVRALTLGAFVATATFGLVQAAYAGGDTVTILGTGQPYTAAPAGQKLVVDFQSSTTSGNGSGVTSNITSSQVVTGSSGSQYAAPADDGCGTCYFAYVAASPANGPTTFTFASPITSLSLLWGSIDTYNTISFSNGTSVTGSDVVAAPNGNQDAAGTKLVNISFATPVTSATFSSGANSFEFDNLAVSAAPEPGTWGLMFGGVALMGLILRGSRRRVFGLENAA